MRSACGSYQIAFNGEIYNWRELKSELDRLKSGIKWRSNCDTEVLLGAITVWGLERTLQKIKGMFAFAIWDNSNRELYLVRDRVGEKPLYYGYAGSNFVFASELKAIVASTKSKLSMNEKSAELMLRFGYVPDGASIYNDVSKLPPGSILKVDKNGSFSKPINWWSFPNLIDRASHSASALDDDEAVEEFERLLKNSVRSQMEADVPLGAFLSGGLDSSTIVALMQNENSGRTKTFTIGFQEDTHNEANFARVIAEHLKTDHTELRVTSADALNLIPKLSHIYDEPFGDSSQIPTYLVSSLTSQHVKVCLSGDAGDELFGGYNRYFWAMRMWNVIKYSPAIIKNFGPKALTAISASTQNKFLEPALKLLPSSLRFSNPGDKMHKLSGYLEAQSPMHLYELIVSQYHAKNQTEQNEEGFIEEFYNKFSSLKNYPEKMMAVDTLTYLPNDILVKVDRAAMSSSLETRLPFLDETLIEFAWNLKFNQRIRKGKGKWIIRQLLSKYVPEYMWDRPKQGFAIPLDQWLRGPLREWAESLLSENSLKNDDFLDTKQIRKIWAQHLAGQNLQYAIWNILSYRAWRQEWL